MLFRGSEYVEVQLPMTLEEARRMPGTGVRVELTAVERDAEHDVYVRDELGSTYACLAPTARW